MQTLGWVVFFVAVMLVLQYKRAALSVSILAFSMLLLLVSFFSDMSPAGLIVLWALAVLLFAPFAVLPLRRRIVTRYLFAFYKKVMPGMSRTEKEALSAGGVGWEREIFSGMPNWVHLQEMRSIQLTDEEKQFLAGPVEQLCGMIDNWKINHVEHEVSEEIWSHLKKHGFFGLIIPKKYGGKEFSALAHSQIIVKVASVSVAVGCIVSVPNSLGPAELLLHYGTEEQKNYYLPRLAQGKEIPCFALTSPVAGSDASSIEDYGIVCKRKFEGQETLGILLNWNKRYITLSPVATLVGLAFKLYDPDHLLGKQQELGITCALIPATTPGVVTGRRHFPVCSHFPNGPTQGNDVFIPLEWVIGGADRVGAGWRMLMECLAAGRAISLPSMVTGGAKRVMFASGAYARIRRQFKVAIGNFGGIQEALARIGGYGFWIEALRLFGVCQIDVGVKSAVASAISKYHTTQIAREVINDAMDIHGGKGICMGPNNYLAQSHLEGPISITVEGANILTRSMIIFGQGAIRCHPYVLQEMTAASESDAQKGLVDFDQAFFKHLGMISSNKVRAFILALSASRLAQAPDNELRRYYQHVSRFAAVFAYLADVAMFTLGAQLKRKERLSARLGDMLSYLYTASAVFKYYELQNQKELLPMAQWVCEELLYQLQASAHEFLLNFPNRWMARWLRVVIFPLGQRFDRPSDRLGKRVADAFLEPSKARDILTTHLYTASGAHQNPISDIQITLETAIQVEPLIKILQEAKKKKLIQARSFAGDVQAAVEASVLSAEEGRKLMHYNELYMHLINVDDFSQDELQKSS